MCDIYENAHLTISATSSPNCTVGMLDFSNNSDRQFHGTNAAGGRYSYIATPGFRAHPSFLTEVGERTKYWPLLDRAWAFQERMLSPRVLHFSRGELIWECQEETFCECGLMENHGKEKQYHEALRRCDGAQLESIWRELVYWYSRLSLTFQSDKLPALSGLAQRFQNLQPGAKYLAGVWDKSLIEDLMWLNPHSVRPFDRADQKSLCPWRAPSWSWAVMNDVVVFSTGSYYFPRTDREKKVSFLKTYITVISAHCILASSDPTGEVLGGSLEITGRIFKAKLFRNRDSIVTLSIRGSSATFPASGYSSLLYLDAGDDFSETLPGFPKDKKVFCLPLARIRRYHLEDTIAEVECGTVLVPTGQRLREYRRIGLAVLPSKRGKPEVLSKFWRKHLSCWENGGNNDTITIV
jgi:hypothetical protein